MTFYKNIKDKSFDDKSIVINLLFMLICIYIIGSSFSFSFFKFPLILIGLVTLLFSRKNAFNIHIWYVFILILSIDLIAKYFREANHHFLLLYVALIVFLYLKDIYNFKLFVKNIQYLTIIVVFFAGIQKMISQQFISGEYYYYMLNTGRFFKSFLNLSPELSEIVNLNKSEIQNLELVNPNKGTSIYLQSIDQNLKMFSIIFSWVTIAIELIVSVVLFFIPKKNITHILLIILIIGIFLTRLETGFLSILTISGLSLSSNSKISLIYIFLTLFFFTLMITKIGFY